MTNSAVNFHGGPAPAGTGACFELAGAQNNCAFENLIIQRFGGDAFRLTAAAPGTDENTASNTLFKSVFTNNIWGAAYRISGLCNATWLMCNQNSVRDGGWVLDSGLPTQSNINIIGNWYESGGANSSDYAIICGDVDQQAITIIGGNFQ